MVDKLRIKIGDLGDAVATLSGGNQQKVVIGKWLMTGPRVILLNDPTRGIDVGTKQELYQLLRDLAAEGAAILFYTTDYDELIGCCDRVLILYDGAVVRELEGAGHHRDQHRDERPQSGSGPGRRGRRMSDLRLRLSQNLGLMLAIVLFLIFYLTYNEMHPKGFSSDVLVPNANEAFVHRHGGDGPDGTGADGRPRSLGRGDDDPWSTASAACSSTARRSRSSRGMVLCLLVGTLAGFINGCVVVYGRIQPIIATLATGAVYIGIALFLRPTPGGNVDEDLAWAMSNDLHEMAADVPFRPGRRRRMAAAVAWIPVPLLLGLLVVLLVWLPFRASVTGRGVYAVGSAEGAAYMSGVAINRSKLAAFTLAGFFAAVGGLFLTMQTSSGNADIQQAGGYTLNSIAAVVIGGTSLMGGSGGAIGSAIGALVIRAISFNFRDLRRGHPLLQPLFEGIVLLGAVSLGAARVFRIKNRLELLDDGTCGRSGSPREPPDRHRQRLHPRHPGARHGLHALDPGKASFLSPTYLLQQLQVGAFLGIVAAGMMLVILLGHIDLSVPWTLTTGAMLASAVGGPWAVPVGLAVGVAVASSTASASPTCACPR